MELIKKYDLQNTNQEHLLSTQDALDAFDLFVLGVSITDVKHQLFLPESKLKTLYQRLVETRLMIERIMKGEARLVREEGHYEVDEVTQEQVWLVDVEEVLAPIPETIEELKSISLTLVSKDYDVTEPLFNTNNVEDLVNGINYIIDKIIQHSNTTNNATFDWWKQQISN